MYLGISFAYGPISIAFYKDDCLLIEYTVNQVRSFSENLINEIDILCQKTAVNLNDIQAISLTTGPGSYTSLRMGVTLAKTIGQLLSIPIYPISTLHAIAFQNRFLNNAIFSVIPARKKELNIALFSCSSSMISRLSPDISLSEDQFLAKASQMNGPFNICGSIPTSIKESQTLNSTQIIPTILTGSTLIDMVLKGESEAMGQEKINPCYSHAPNIGIMKYND